MFSLSHRATISTLPNNFAAGTLAALESHKHVAASTSTDASGRAPAGIEDPRHRLATDWRLSVGLSLPVSEAPDTPIPVGWGLVTSRRISAKSSSSPALR